MRLGPLEVRLQAPPRRPDAERVELGERGVSGSPMWGGVLGSVDYNERLNGPEAYDEYDKMRRSDGQVAGALRVLKLPLLNADWHIEAASDQAQDREIAEFIEGNLRDGMSLSFHDWMRQVLLMLDYGAMPFEKVWELRGGLVRLRKLAPRLPRTVIDWELDEAGGLAAIHQQGSSASGFTDVRIPASKIVVYVNELEGSNYRGVSILRPAWKHWFIKDGLERIQAIAGEKRALGVDVGTLKGEDITAQDKTDLERALMSLHAHEKQFFVEIDEQVSYRLEGQARAGIDLGSPIEYHDLRIVRSMIAEFLAMGSGSTGSLAMHKDKTSMTMLALGGVANTITATTDRYLIRPWVNYNWRVSEYPRLRYSHLEARDLEKWAAVVVGLLSGGALTMSPDIEQASRDILDLPTLSGTPDDDLGGLPAGPAKTEAVAAVRRRQLEKIAEHAERIYARGDLTEALRLSVPYRAEMIEALGGDSIEAAAQAAEVKAAVIRELKRQINEGQFDAPRIERL